MPGTKLVAPVVLASLAGLALLLANCGAGSERPLQIGGGPLLLSGAIQVPDTDPAGSTLARVAVDPRGLTWQLDSTLETWRQLPPREIKPEPWAAAPRLRRNLPAPEVSAAAAVVIDEASGAVLYEKNAHQALPPASLTKIATAIIAMERNSLDLWVENDVDSRTMFRSTLMGLLPGDRFTIRDLVYGMMLPSGNDAAQSIARGLYGTEAAFVQQMNFLLFRMGLNDSRFANASGLGGGATQSVSPYDMAMLARYAMSFPVFREVVTTSYWVARGSRNIPMGNINNFLYGYSGADGVKTGYTRSAGQTLVASAVRGGHRLYAVVLNAPHRDRDAAVMLDWAFASFGWDQ